VSATPRLLSALVALDGEALVLHPGDLPYIASPRGPVDLASRPLTAAALDALIQELLPEASRLELMLQGSMQWQAPPTPRFPGERFTIVAAFVHEELWMEVRRQRTPADSEAVPEPPPAEPVPSAQRRTALSSAQPRPMSAEPPTEGERPDRRKRERRMKPQSGPDDLHVPSADELWSGDDNF